MTRPMSDHPAIVAKDVGGVHLRDVEARLIERGINFRRIRVGPSATAIVSAHGARVYGPFFADGRSQSWLPDAFTDADRFADLHERGQWNVGGDRMWIGPEIEYMIPDRERYWDTYTMPPSMDPGAHALSGPHDEPTAYRHMRLPAHLNGGHVTVDLTLRFRAAPDPLRHVGPAPRGVEYAGYMTETTVTTAGSTAPVEAWTLLQVLPGGTVLMPGSAEMRVTDYYEPVDGFLNRRPDGVSVVITGANRFKLGFAAPHVTGRLGYLRAIGNGTSTLVVRSSPLHPGADYAEEPDDRQGHRGDALHVYNDDGGLGGFAELEARGTPVTPDADGTRRPVTDRFMTWWFRGPDVEVRHIAETLLHMRLSTEHDPASDHIETRRT